jgi:uncharacterized protein (TIGR03118 family)
VTAAEGLVVTQSRYVPYSHAHYGGNLVDGAYVLGLFGYAATELCIRSDGDGHINAYNPATGRHLGQLRRPDGRAVVIDGLWGLKFGNGNAAKTGQLMFSAGPDDESHGLLGKIVVAH